MQIKLNNIGKRYNYEWIFRKVNYEFTSDNNYVILGGNGSGKSTLLQVITGNLMQSEGELNYTISDSKIENENIFKHLSFAAPYLELFEEFTLAELTQLENAKDKQLKQYSSGMKQRVRLVLAILSDTSLLLLDEPTSNLDKKAIDWYQNLINNYSKNRLIFVCSNQQEYEYPFCNKQLFIEEFK